MLVIGLLFLLPYHRSVPRPHSFMQLFNCTLEDPVVRATMEKLVCAFSDVFRGSKYSTFTDDIARLRHGFLTASCEDDFVCPRLTGRKD